MLSLYTRLTTIKHTFLGKTGIPVSRLVTQGREKVYALFVSPSVVFYVYYVVHVRTTCLRGTESYIWNPVYIPEGG